MKYLLAMLLMPLICAAQGQIEGLGKFKIGKSTLAIVDEVATELKCVIEPVSMGVAVDDIGIMKPSIVELIKDNNLPLAPPKNVSPCPNSRTYFINKYKIADIDVTCLYLIFNNQKLVKIICKSSTLPK